MLASTPGRRGWLLLLLLPGWLGAGCGLGHHPMEGQPVPDLQLVDIQGGAHHLREYLGRETILAFWLDCVVCRAELPWLDSAARQSAGALQVVAVNSRDQPSDVRALARQLKLGIPMLLDRDRSAERAFQVVTVPTAFRIDPSGRIVEVQLGTAGYDLALRSRRRATGREATP